MMTIKGLVDLVLMESRMYGGMSEEQWINEGCLIPEAHRISSEEGDLPPINYRLELLRHEDGTYEWVE